MLFIYNLEESAMEAQPWIGRAIIAIWVFMAVGGIIFFDTLRQPRVVYVTINAK